MLYLGLNQMNLEPLLSLDRIKEVLNVSNILQVFLIIMMIITKIMLKIY